MTRDEVTLSDIPADIAEDRPRRLLARPAENPTGASMGTIVSKDDVEQAPEASK
jgi:hypothetical protein